MAKLQPLNGMKWNIDQLNTLLDQPNGITSGAGVTNNAGITSVQYETFTFSNVSIATTANGAAGSQGSLKFFTFPAGNIFIQGATTNLNIARVGTNITATAAVVGSVGTVTASNADATLTGTEANVVPSTTSTLTAGAGSTKGESTGALTIDGTSTNGELYLNFAIPQAGASGNDALLVNGTITIAYLNLGDN